MKKILLILLSFFMMEVVLASEAPRIVSITNKCNVVDGNEVIIPIKVSSLNNSFLTSVISEYSLGYVDNVKDNMIVKVTNINGDNIENVIVDNKRDEMGRSQIKYYLNNDIKISKNSEIMSFNLKYEFYEEIPKNIYVLGNDIILGNSDTCEYINGYKIKEVEKEIYVDLSEVDHSRMINNMIVKVIIGFLIIIIVILSVIIIKNKNTMNRK